MPKSGKKSLDKYIDALSNLRANRAGDHTSPHKPVMMLAVLALADNGKLIANRIEYGPELLELFREYFDVVKTDQDKCNPLLPFSFLRGDKFWHHKPLPGKEDFYQALSGPGGAIKLREIVDSAYLDDELYQLVTVSETREILRDALINRYFPKHRVELLKISRNERDIGQCRKVMEHQAEEGYGLKDLAGYRKEIRNTAFCRTVTDAYDYTCAACGLRVILEDLAIVDAAHLIPFSESHDDDPRNGMALCKNHHWAMDSYLIAPGSDNKWHVSKVLDKRISDLEDLVAMAGQTIILPSKKNYHPRADALEWRVSRLRKTA